MYTVHIRMPQNTTTTPVPCAGGSEVKIIIMCTWHWYLVKSCSSTHYAILMCKFYCAVYAVVVCPSVTSQYCIEAAGRIELVFGMGASFHLSHTVFIRKFGYLQKQGYFPLELCPKTLDLENFTMASWWQCQQNCHSRASYLYFV